jgi:hypothetical protein
MLPGTLAVLFFPNIYLFRRSWPCSLWSYNVSSIRQSTLQSLQSISQAPSLAGPEPRTEHHVTFQELLLDNSQNWRARREAPRVRCADESPFLRLVRRDVRVTSHAGPQSRIPREVIHIPPCGIESLLRVIPLIITRLQCMDLLERKNVVKSYEWISVPVIRATQACWNCGFKVLPGRYCLKCGKKN